METDNSTNSHFRIVEVADDRIPKPSTKEMYDKFTEDLMSSRFDSQLWTQTFKEATEPGRTDRTLIRGLRILIIRQTLQVIILTLILTPDSLRNSSKIQKTQTIYPTSYSR